MVANRMVAKVLDFKLLLFPLYEYPFQNLPIPFNRFRSSQTASVISNNIYHRTKQLPVILQATCFF